MHMFIKNTHKNIKLFIAALFIVSNWKQCKCIDRRVDKLLSIYLYNGILHRRKK